MTPAELRLTCIELFGKRGWQIGLARFLKKPDGTHVNVRTVRRWASEKTKQPVPFWVDELLKAELARRSGVTSIAQSSADDDRSVSSLTHVCLAVATRSPPHQPEPHITSNGWESALAVERVKLPKPFPFGSLGFSLAAALPFRLWPVLTITHGRD